MTRFVIGLTAMATLLRSASTLHAQSKEQSARQRNATGLVIGATETPSVTGSNGEHLVFNSSLALGAEYDYQIVPQKTVVSVGVDFLASPFDVKLSSPPPDVSAQYAYLFFVPHARVALLPGRSVRPWFLFGGGYADFAS